MYEIFRKYRLCALCFLGGGLAVGILAFVVQGQAFGFENVPIFAVLPLFFVGAVAAAVIFELISRNRNALMERRLAEQELLRRHETEELERRRVAATQREIEERFRNLARIAPVGIFETDADGACVHVNRQWSDITGVSEASARRGGWVGAIHIDDRERVASEWRAAVQNNSEFVQEYRFMHADGEVFWVLGQAVANRDAEGVVTGYVGTATDITRHRETEHRQRQTYRMEAVGQLTGGVAHDFNNLLAVIMSNAELLQLRPKDGDRMINAIIRAVTRGAELTQRLLAFSRRQPLKPQALDVGKLVSGLSNLLVRTLGETVSVEIKGVHGLWPALADPGQVENALLNLALNARDAMPGGGTLKISSRNARLNAADVADFEEMQPGEYVELSVRDTGDGMPGDVRMRAFEPFFTTKEVGQGSGLGLSMVYGFAKQSGGHAVIRSEEGQGTTVTLYLPRGTAAPVTAYTESSADVPPGRGEAIMVIEDSEEVRDLAAKLLTGLDYLVTAVPDVADARRILADGAVLDLVLSDVILPGGMSGPEFAREIRASHPDLKVIFMSGFATEADTSDGFPEASQVLIRKPFQRLALATALRDALDD